MDYVTGRCSGSCDSPATYKYSAGKAATVAQQVVEVSDALVRHVGIPAQKYAIIHHTPCNGVDRNKFNSINDQTTL